MSAASREGEPSEAELDELLAFGIEIARAAGELQLAGFGQAVIENKSERELVTRVDRECEELLVSRISARYPEHGFLAEEGHVTREQRQWRWIIDPVDGTTNYAHRVPAFAVSLGLEHAEAGLVVGVVFAPYLEELFYARRGAGAWFERRQQKRRLAVSQTRELSQAILATGFAYVRDQTPNDNLANWTTLSKRGQGLRRIGSAALDLAYVADGRFDAFWEMHLKPYDMAAGTVLIQEAGGRVSDFWGGQRWLFGQNLVASNGHLHEEIRAALAPVEPDGWIEIP